MQGLWTKLRSNWNGAVAAAAWLLALLTPVLLPVQVGPFQFGGSGKLLKLAAIVVPLLVGLLTVPLLRRSTRHHAMFWWKLAAVGMVLSLAAFFAYNWYATDWTVPYANRPVVIGSEFTPHGKDYVSQSQQRITPTDWIMAHGGRIDEIWTKRSIDIRCAILAGLYLVSLNLFAATIVYAMQSIYCSTRPKRPGRH